MIKYGRSRRDERDPGVPGKGNVKGTDTTKSDPRSSMESCTWQLAHQMNGSGLVT